MRLVIEYRMPACIIFGVENLLQDGKIHLGPCVFKLNFSFLVWEEFSSTDGVCIIISVAHL